MATYLVSDIHGELEQLKTVLKKANFSSKDTLYVLGDVVDRGPNPIKALQFLMAMPNAVCLIGNHELMCLTNLKLLLNEISEDFLDAVSNEDYGNLVIWLANGAAATIREFAALDREARQDIIDYLGEFIAYEELSVGDKEYLFVHAGLGNFSQDRLLEDYTIDELVWKRTDYEVPYFPDITVVTGHTPTQNISGNKRPGYIYRANNHIAIDCGACFEGGRLAMLCLETGEEFYSRD